ncbi:MAG: tetratricopeptide repeat protein [Acidobacteriota bacterium]
MIRMFLLVLWLAPSALSQSPTKPVDLCAAPPDAVPPALPARLLEGQGYLNFPITTGNAKAQQFFNQGVVQMHSFWAVEAERSFLQAAELDPEAPMPHWGIAMVAAGDFRPRFQLEGQSRKKKKPAPTGGTLRAIEAAERAVRLSTVPGKATKLERLYIAAVAARRDRIAKDPDADYIAGLRRLLAEFPQETEAKSYLALHLMRGFTTPDKAPRESSMEAVALLRQLLAEAPDHPGVHHYVIHGFEGSHFASEAWPSCRRYPQLTSNIPHALHMPGHIYAQTGKWKEAAESFEQAADNELRYISADALYGKGHHGHNVQFLVSTYCFLGEYEKALAAARGLMMFSENPREASQPDNTGTPYRQGWFALMRTLVHFQKWDELLGGDGLPVLDKPREKAWRCWALGLAHAAKGQVAEARLQSKAMAAALKDFRGAVKVKVPEVLLIAQKELQGHIQVQSGRLDKGLETLRVASLQERALRYSEPPAYPRPVLEALGQLALRHGRLSVAEAAFHQALAQFPESTHARKGLAEIRLRNQAGAGGL